MFGIVDVLGRPDLIGAAMARPELAMGGLAVAMGTLALLGTCWFARRSRRRMAELAEDFDRRLSGHRDRYKSALDTIESQKRRIEGLTKALDAAITKSTNGVGSPPRQSTDPPAD